MHVASDTAEAAPKVPTSPSLPSSDAWRAAAAHHRDRFAPLARGARVGLLARTAPIHMLVWEACPDGVDARLDSFAGYGACKADIVFAADDVALREIRATEHARIFEVLRARIRDGAIVCYWLKRRCVLEYRGFDELLDALGFAFMGACR
jgi:hypothetical protein